MGYYADSIDTDFVIPADKVEAALAAINDKENFSYDSLNDAVSDLSGFEGSDTDKDGNYSLGWHTEKYQWTTDELLAILAQFAKEGSYVRFVGEDHSLFGFIVRDGKLEEQYGQITWL